MTTDTRARPVATRLSLGPAAEPTLEIEITALDTDLPTLSVRRTWFEGGVVCVVGTQSHVDLKLPRTLYSTVGQRVLHILWDRDGLRAEAVPGPLAPVVLDGEILEASPRVIGQGEHELVLGAGHRFRLDLRIVEAPSEPIAPAASRLTPYNDAYKTCERTFAELLIYPENLDPALITERLGLVPTQMSVKGVDERTPAGVVRPAPHSLWALSSEGKIASKDLRRHLDWLLARLLPARAQLRALQSTPGTRMTVSCVWESAHGHGGPTLWPEQMGALTELGLECGFDVSFYGEDDE